jgi:hypothetical protein
MCSRLLPILATGYLIRPIIPATVIEFGGHGGVSENNVRHQQYFSRNRDVPKLYHFNYGFPAPLLLSNNRNGYREALLSRH